jgi:glycosyltransferase involved in cell wall biosynthesis
MSTNIPRVALFLRYIGGGGAETAMIFLAHGLIEQGLKVDFVLSQAGGPHMWKIPAEARIIDLQNTGNFASLKGLVHYLRQEEPKALISAMHFNNEIAILAKRLAGVATRIVVCEQNHLSLRSNHEVRLSKRLTPLFARLSYGWADAVIAASQGVAKNLHTITGLPLEQIRVIYNPVVTPEIDLKSQEPLDHPWFADNQPPVILGVGKLEPQKDFPTLIRAFAKVRQIRPVRLVILGWGPESNRLELEALVQELKIEADVDLPGYVNNPYTYMAKAAVFVLSSRWEGFGNVVAEALAVGTPVVSTDCESGPAEILDNGRYGTLVPVGDNQALAEAILNILSGTSQSVDKSWLNNFSLSTITQQYLDVLGFLQLSKHQAQKTSQFL